MRFHHVGVAARSIDEAYAGLCDEAAAAISDVTFDPEQGVRLRLLDIGGLPVEIVYDDGDGPVAPWLKRGARLYHICYEVDDLDRTLADARRRGSAVVSGPKPAVLFGRRRVAFVMDRVLGLVEFLERG